ncbi:MAG: hypothetical protein ACUVQ1_02485 [Candidatus Kapaibacteriales bacterium]
MKQFWIVLFFLQFSVTFASEFTDRLSVGGNYIFRLINGDLVSGELLEVIQNGSNKELKIETELGIARIDFSQIVEISLMDKFYRQDHRYFLLPTAIGIENNHFIGATWLFFINVGIGISNHLSLILGRSVIPSLTSNQQLSLIDIKGTLPKFAFEDIFRELYFAFGGNLAFVNHNNRFIHFYGTGTVVFYKTSLTCSIFYKYGSKDYYSIRYSNYFQDFVYEDGAFGIAVGLDTRFPTFRDLHFIAEIWNVNITKPTNSGVFTGIRISNSRISMDFGFAWFTQPFIVPFVNFIWTPF